MHSRFRPYARSPFASPSFPSHMTRGPGPLSGRLARHGHYSVGRILPLRLPFAWSYAARLPVDIPIRPNCCRLHDKGTGHLSCGFSHLPRPLTGRNSPRFGGSCQAPKLLDCPFFPPMQAPAASYGAFGSVAAEGIDRSGNCLPAQLGLGCIMPTNRFDAGVPGGVFAGAERAHAPNPLNLSR